VHVRAWRLRRLLGCRARKWPSRHPLLRESGRLARRETARRARRETCSADLQQSRTPCTSGSERLSADRNGIRSSGRRCGLPYRTGQLGSVSHRQFAVVNAHICATERIG
jgi:hypothetical protein